VRQTARPPDQCRNPQWYVQSRHLEKAHRQDRRRAGRRMESRPQSQQRLRIPQERSRAIERSMIPIAAGRRESLAPSRTEAITEVRTARELQKGTRHWFSFILN